MDISAILASTLSPHLTERDAAIAELDNFAAQNYLGYTVSLVQELANETSDPNIRKAAGLAVKNRLTAREHMRKEEYRQKWTSLPVGAKNSVKQAILATLGSPVLAAGKTAAQIVAAFVELEILCNEWADVIDFLVNNIIVSEVPLNMKYSSLLTIGYICETTDPAVFQSKSDQIISAVIQGARREETNEVRHVAIKTLFNCLELARPYFEDKDQRDVIMEVVCDATQSSDVSVQSAAFECLCRIMQLYYHTMQFYMESALYEITAAGMEHPNEQVALQAVEFWSTVCDEEINIQHDTEEDVTYKRKGKRRCLNFAKNCLPYVLHAIFSLLTKQEEDEDDDEWNVSMAAGTCLSLLAQCVGNDIIEPILEFVQKNIEAPDWRSREAAVLAFGSIVDGPDVDMLAELVERALPCLIGMMTDPDVQVKDSTAWTLGRISDLLVRVVQSTGYLADLVDALIAGLSDSPRVTTNCCWSITNLITHLAPENLDLESHQLSAYFETIVTALLNVTNRTDNRKNCRTSAYEAIAQIVSQCNKRYHPMVFQLCNVIIDRFNQSITVEQSLQTIDDRMCHAELLTNLCCVLTSIERQLGKEIQPCATEIANIIVQLLNTAENHPTVVEDVLLVAGALMTALEEEFEPFADHFVPFLYPALNNHQEYQVCQVAVAVVGDICRALGDKALKYCDGFVTVLLENLRSSELDATVKPALLSCFGDIALAIGGSFETYLDVTMPVLQQAATAHRSAGKSVDARKLIKKIQSALLEAYIGIVQGLRCGGKSRLLLPYTTGMINFLYDVYSSKDRTDTMLRNTIGLLGDLGETFIKGDIKVMLGDPWVRACVREGRVSENTTFATKETSKWAKEILRIASKP